MLKARVMLGLMILGFTIGGTFLWQSGLEYGWKVFFTTIISLLYLSACLLMAVTFFALDAEGRIPRGSFVYRHLSRFYSDEPEYIRICPAFWIITWEVLLAFLACVAFSLLTWAIGYGIFAGYAPETLVNIGKFLGVLIGAIILFVVLAVVFIAGFVSLTDKIKSSILLGLVVICGIYCFLFFFFGFVTFILDYTRGSGLYEALSEAVKISAAIPLAIAAVCGGAMGIVYLACFVFLWIGNSLPGKLLIGLYYKVCPVISVEPKPQTTSE